MIRLSRRNSRFIRAIQRRNTTAKSSILIYYHVWQRRFADIFRLSILNFSFALCTLRLPISCIALISQLAALSFILSSIRSGVPIRFARWPRSFSQNILRVQQVRRWSAKFTVPNVNFYLFFPGHASFALSHLSMARAASFRVRSNSHDKSSTTTEGVTGCLLLGFASTAKPARLFAWHETTWEASRILDLAGCFILANGLAKNSFVASAYDRAYPQPYHQIKSQTDILSVYLEFSSFSQGFVYHWRSDVSRRFGSLSYWLQLYSDTFTTNGKFW